MSLTAVPIKDAPQILREESFHAGHFFKIAIAVGVVALAVFYFYETAAFILLGVSCWALFSCLLIILSDFTEGFYLEKPIHALYSICMEINAIFYACFLFPRTLFDAYHLPAKEELDKGTPILMVNGYLSFGSTWDVLRNRLRLMGLGPIYTMNVGSGRSIKTYATYVQGKIKEIQAQTGQKTVILIGHSKGGLVSSYYATHLVDKTTTEVTHVVTIGSPLKGTIVAYAGFGRDAQEMRPNSPFVQGLEQKIQDCVGTQFFHIASDADLISAPSVAVIERGLGRCYVLKNLGHLSLVFSSRVAQKIQEWLVLPVTG